MDDPRMPPTQPPVRSDTLAPPNARHVAADAMPVDTTRWISGPDADPLRPTPWLAGPEGRRLSGYHARATRPLPRPRRFAPRTLGRRLRSLFVLLCVLALIAGVAVLGFELSHALFGTPLPRLTLPALPRLPFPWLTAP